MTITLSNATVAADAPWGTVIGLLSVSGLKLKANPWAYFGIRGNQLMVAWQGIVATTGGYQIVVQEAGGTRTTLDIMITPAGTTAPPPPPGPTVKVNGSNGPVTVSAGATISATVANGPGNPGDWLGVYAVGAPSGPGNPGSWKWLSTDDARGSVPPAPGVKTGMVHLVVPAAAGQYEVRFFANSSFTVVAKSAAITVAVAVPSAVPKSVTLSPPTASLADNTAAGAVVSAISVAMSDGSAFSGALMIAANNMVGLSGGKAVLTRGLAASDDGAHSFVITASQGNVSKSAALAINVTATAPSGLVLSLSPLPAQINDDSPAGMVLSTATVTYTDGTVPTSISLTSSAPTFVAVKGMQLVLARALTAADDGSHNVTIQASDGLGATAAALMFGARDA